jgi:hypothetical protein
MKKLLMFLVLLSVSLGMRAANYTWSQGDYQVVLTSVQIANSDTYQKITVNSPGALAAFMEAAISDSNNPLYGLGGNSNRVNLQIEGELNSYDLAALNTTEYAPLATFTSLDLKKATIANTSDISGMSMSNLQYLRLPSNFNTITSMNSVKTNNSSLKVALSTDKNSDEASKIVINSFQENGFNESRDVFLDGDHNNGYNGFWELQKVKYVTMSGMIGDSDLFVESTGKHFGNTPAVWDFTGATFGEITLNTDEVTGSYYAANDPFCEHGASYPQYPYTTNAFYYFKKYAKETVQISLPSNMTDLPDVSMQGLASSNKDNYKLVYGKTEEELAEMYPDLVNGNTGTIGGYVPIKELVLPEKLTRVGYEAVAGGHVESVVIGKEIEEICGGAFSGCDELSEVTFTTGTKNCRLGDSAFGGCKNMKHIELIEGIISLGHNCFNNSQHVESVRLPESLEEIGNGSFGLCYALSSIVIPPNVRKIGREAFYLAALKSIYLTTTDPANIPVIFSAGTTINPNNFSTFYTGAIDGNITCAPKDSDDPNGGFGDMTWEQAANWYFTNNRTMAALYFPEQLYYKVRGDICEQYKYHSSDGGKLPSQDDIARRYNLAGLSTSEGEYTQDGWAQFLLMQAYDPSDPDSKVLTKDYDDVWYTMCFPFDLTDEQLTEAFNRSFNIVDFSGVEVTTTETTRNIVLHFNNVAETKYKDDFGNVYERIMITDTNGKQVAKRLKDGNYEYNVYTRVENGTTYYYGHIIPANASTNEKLFKTKIFAKYTNYNPSGTTSSNAFSGRVGTDLYTIDGYLALAGHPYMIHPNVGVVQGVEQNGVVGTKKACRLAGIVYKNVDNPETETVETNYDWLYEQQARTVDLGGEIVNGAYTGNPYTENNFNQAAYSDYQGQTYTFKGNWRKYSAEGDTYVAQNPEPTPVENPGTEPVYSAPSQPTTGPLPEPTAPPTNPEANTPGWETVYNNFLYWAVQQNWSYSDRMYDGGWATYLNLSTPISEEQFNHYVGRARAYAEYLTDMASFDQAQYDRDYAAYLENQAAWAAWNEYNSNPDQHYQTWFNTVHKEWQDKKDEYDSYPQRHADWEAPLANYKVWIPYRAYFLGRATGEYPRYYREVAPVDENRTGGRWSQYAAIVIPNGAALAAGTGVEDKMDLSVEDPDGAVKGVSMAFNEDFVGEFDANEIKDIIADAEKNGQKVEYLNIIYSINGEIVGKGANTLNNLPQGMYIINGKKYLVK